MPMIKFRRMAMIGGLSLVLLCLQSCGGGDDGGANAGFKVELEMRATNGAPRSSYTVGTTIVFALTVTNLSGAAQTLTLPTGQIYDLAVLAEGSATPRWRWSFNQTFTPAATNLTFGGKQSLTYLYLWNGVLEDGTQLMPGSYDFRGTLAYANYAADWRADDELAAPVRKIAITN